MVHEVAQSSVAEPPTINRRVRRREQSRDLVYRAAVSLFIAQGFDETTMDQIAERADVARATVFNHFPRKTAFLDEWTARRRQQYMDAIHKKDVSGWSLDKTLNRYMVEVAEVCTRTRVETVALLSATLHQTNVLSRPQLGNDIAELIRGVRRSGNAPQDIHAGHAGLMLATSYFVILSQWIETDPPPFDLESELLKMLRVVLYGVLAAPTDANPSQATKP